MQHNECHGSKTLAEPPSLEKAGGPVKTVTDWRRGSAHPMGLVGSDKDCSHLWPSSHRLTLRGTESWLLCPLSSSAHEKWFLPSLASLGRELLNFCWPVTSVILVLWDAEYKWLNTSEAEIWFTIGNFVCILLLLSFPLHFSSSSLLTWSSFSNPKRFF